MFAAEPAFPACKLSVRFAAYFTLTSFVKAYCLLSEQFADHFWLNAKRATCSYYVGMSRPAGITLARAGRSMNSRFFTRHVIGDN